MAKSASLSSKGIRHKLFTAVCLMSVIPILVCLNFAFPSLFISFLSETSFKFIILIMIFISLLGFVLIKQIIEHIIRMAREVKSIAEGDTDKYIEIKSEDEIGQLGSAINQLTSRIKENLNELEDYGSKTAQINIDIQKRVVTMSGLLQISSLITKGAKLDDILHLCVEKLKSVADSSAAFILFLDNNGKMVIRAQAGLSADCGASLAESDECVSRVFQGGALTVIDAKNFNASCLKLVSFLNIKNLLCLPIYLARKPAAIAGIGNNIPDFIYKRDDQELLDIFGKQMAIAIESDWLTAKVEGLEIKDMLTGLYNERYVRHHLDEEIKRAIIYQRPCGFILARIQNFTSYQKMYGQVASEAVFKKIASSLSASFSGIEKVGRFADYDFAVILPEKNKRQAQKTAEELQKNVEALFQDEPVKDKRLGISVAVVENPLDGVDSNELISIARNLLNNK